MDYESDDSVYDPDYNPSENDSSENDSSESDSGNECWNPPIPQRRTSTFSEERLPSLPNVERRRTPRIQAAEAQNLEADVPSTSGTTSSEMTEREWVNQKLTNLEWQMPTHDDPEAIAYTVPYSGMKDVYSGILANANPLDYFELFLTRDILELITDQTNLYAAQHVLTMDTTPGSRVHAWVPVTVDEIGKFLALIGWMGLVKLPSIKDYWRVHALYGLPLARTVMPRNRFELILKFLHFDDNTDVDPDDRLYKLRNILEKFISNFQNAYMPGQKICIDESLIPWRGRLIFRQYIPNKASKYGIKVFKLCTEKGYTWNLMVYCGKSRSQEADVSEKTVMELAQDLLDEGRTIYTDNYYTSIPLAYRLRRRKTHLVGTLRSHRKHLPKDVVAMKLKRGEMCAKQTGDGIVVLKWRDKRDVRMLSTKTSALKTVPVKCRNKPDVMKPECIIDYNNGKSSIDISDQMATYGSALRRCTKWYRKLFIEILWGTSLVNAHFLYNLNTTKKKMTITEFREQVIMEMIKKFSQTAEDVEPAAKRKAPNVKHHLIDNKVNEKLLRGRCKECYKMYGRDGKIIDGKKIKAAQVSTKCSTCDIFLCRNCFNRSH